MANIELKNIEKSFGNNKVINNFIYKRENLPNLSRMKTP